MLTNFKNKLKDHYIFIKIRIKNNPESPLYLSQDDEGNYTLDNKIVSAIPIGEKRTIQFLSLHDMQEHQLAGDFTNARYLEHLVINAVHILEGTYKKLDEWNVQISYQPFFLKPIKQLSF